MKPIIKWPGGKSGEIGKLEPFIPDFDRYVEPFVGGGALYFYLEPERALINDNSRHLMDFYTLVQAQDPTLRALLLTYSEAFAELQRRCRDNESRLRALFRIYQVAADEALDIADSGVHEGLALQVAGESALVERLLPDGQSAGMREGRAAERERYRRFICEAVESKLKRTVANHRRRPMSEADIFDNIVTGFTGGFYLYFREVFNRIEAGALEVSVPARCANFFFVREYCYGSMFRYNAKGQFNIPYGGISYNRKDMAAKVERMFTPRMAALLGRTRIECRDFEEMLEEAKLTERDFIFLDPPYDTEFSDYEGRDFTRKDHERLAAYLERTKARFLLVIKNTEFIYALYEGKFPMYAFENRYAYNVRSRNEQMAEHLIITNCPPGKEPGHDA